jgi:hypothetical protein
MELFIFYKLIISKSNKNKKFNFIRNYSNKIFLFNFKIRSILSIFY